MAAAMLDVRLKDGGVVMNGEWSCDCMAIVQPVHSTSKAGPEPDLRLGETMVPEL